MMWIERDEGMMFGCGMVSFLVTYRSDSIEAFTICLMHST